MYVTTQQETPDVVMKHEDTMGEQVYKFQGLFLLGGIGTGW